MKKSTRKRKSSTKGQLSLTPFLQYNAGDVEKNIAFFNHAMGQDTMAEAEGQGEGSQGEGTAGEGGAGAGMGESMSIYEELRNVADIDEKAREIANPDFAAAVRAIKSNNKARDKAGEVRKAPESGKETLPKDLKPITEARGNLNNIQGPFSVVVWEEGFTEEPTSKMDFNNIHEAKAEFERLADEGKANFILLMAEGALIKRWLNPNYKVPEEMSAANLYQTLDRLDDGGFALDWEEDGVLNSDNTEGRYFKTKREAAEAFRAKMREGKKFVALNYCPSGEMVALWINPNYGSSDSKKLVKENKHLKEELAMGVTKKDFVAFLRDAIKGCADGYSGCWYYHLGYSKNGTELYYVVALGESAEAFGGKEAVRRDGLLTDKSGDYVVMGKIAVNIDSMQSDWDYDWGLPFYEGADALDTRAAFPLRLDLGKWADDVLDEFKHLSDNIIDADGRIHEEEEDWHDDEEGPFTLDIWHGVLFGDTTPEVKEYDKWDDAYSEFEDIVAGRKANFVIIYGNAEWGSETLKFWINPDFKVPEKYNPKNLYAAIEGYKKEDMINDFKVYSLEEDTIPSNYDDCYTSFDEDEERIAIEEFKGQIKNGAFIVAFTISDDLVAFWINPNYKDALKESKHSDDFPIEQEIVVKDLDEQEIGRYNEEDDFLFFHDLTDKEIVDELVSRYGKDITIAKVWSGKPTKSKILYDKDYMYDELTDDEVVLDNLKESTQLNEIYAPKMQEFVNRAKKDFSALVSKTQAKLNKSNSKAEDYIILGDFWAEFMNKAASKWGDSNVLLLDDAAMYPMPESVAKQFCNILFDIKNINLLYDLPIDVGFDDYVEGVELGADKAEVMEWVKTELLGESKKTTTNKGTLKEEYDAREQAYVDRFEDVNISRKDIEKDSRLAEHINQISRLLDCGEILGLRNVVLYTYTYTSDNYVEAVYDFKFDALLENDPDDEDGLPGWKTLRASDNGGRGLEEGAYYTPEHDKSDHEFYFVSQWDDDRISWRDNSWDVCDEIRDILETYCGYEGVYDPTYVLEEEIDCPVSIPELRFDIYNKKDNSLIKSLEFDDKIFYDEDVNFWEDYVATTSIRSLNIINDERWVDTYYGWDVVDKLNEEYNLKDIVVKVHNQRDDVDIGEFDVLSYTGEDEEELQEKLFLSEDLSVKHILDEDLFEEESSKPSKSLRKSVLTAYLELSPDQVHYSRWNRNGVEFDTDKGTYLVLTEEEAEEMAKEYVIDLIDDMGIDSFTDDFRWWIQTHALDTSWFEEAMNECYEGYADDIESESDDVYENRLISEMVENGILTEDDFDNWGEDHPTVREGVDIESKKEEFVEHILDDIGDPVEWYIDDFGGEAFNQVVKQNGLLDEDAVAEESVSQDGAAHFLATYDGEEHDLGYGLYAYRTD